MYKANIKLYNRSGDGYGSFNNNSSSGAFKQIPVKKISVDETKINGVVSEEETGCFKQLWKRICSAFKVKNRIVDITGRHDMVKKEVKKSSNPVLLSVKPLSQDNPENSCATDKSEDHSDVKQKRFPRAKSLCQRLCSWFPGRRQSWNILDDQTVSDLSPKCEKVVPGTSKNACFSTEPLAVTYEEGWDKPIYSRKLIDAVEQFNKKYVDVVKNLETIENDICALEFDLGWTKDVIFRLKNKKVVTDVDRRIISENERILSNQLKNLNRKKKEKGVLAKKLKKLDKRKIVDDIKKELGKLDMSSATQKLESRSFVEAKRHYQGKPNPELSQTVFSFNESFEGDFSTMRQYLRVESPQTELHRVFFDEYGRPKAYPENLSPLLPIMFHLDEAEQRTLFQAISEKLPTQI